VFSQNKLESFIKGTQCTNQYGVKVNLYWYLHSKEREEERCGIE
jgi:hypothetical protein